MCWSIEQYLVDSLNTARKLPYWKMKTGFMCVDKHVKTGQMIQRIVNLFIHTFCTYGLYNMMIE